jgi:hypothetical protein
LLLGILMWRMRIIFVAEDWVTAGNHG